MEHNRTVQAGSHKGKADYTNTFTHPFTRPLETNMITRTQAGNDNNIEKLEN